MDMYGLGLGVTNTVPGFVPMEATSGQYSQLVQPQHQPQLAPAQSFSNDLVVRALNYHGQQLTSFVKETKFFEHLDMKNVDYHLYHQRSRELRMEDRGKRLLLHRFISQNSEKLYRERREVEDQTNIKLDNDLVEEHAALLPPFEVFTNVHEDDRCRHFFDTIKVGDSLMCRVGQKSMSGLMLSVLCLDPVTNKSRYIEDLKIRCFCPAAEMVPACDPSDPLRSYEAGDIVRVVCLEVKLESQRLMAGMKTSGLKVDLQNIVKLGLCQTTDLPASLSYSSQALEKKIPFSLFLEKSVGFINPTNVNHLAGELGLEVKGDSLMAGLTGRFRPETYASSLRRDQASKWAYKHVAQGIKYFKAGNNVEAFQCLNQALNIDNDNVEGLVARGALYANNGGLDKAVEDFEAALTINRNHKNARKYLCETLIAVARNHEDENKVDSAIETYQRILTVVPDHKEALDSVFFLRGKPKDAPLRDDHVKHDKNKPKLLLEDEKKAEKSEKKKKKKRRKHSSSASSSGSGSESDESRRREKKKKKDKKSRSPPSPSPPSRSEGAGRPVSPFSARMAVGAGGVPAGGAMNMPEEFKPPTDQKSTIALPLPDLREDIKRIKSQKSLEGETTGPRIPAGFPLIDLTKPPPGYNPGYFQAGFSQSSEQEYDEKVRRFLQETTQEPRRTEAAARKSRRSHSRSREKKRKSRSRERSSRSRRREKSKEKEERRSKRSRGSSGSQQSKGGEPILIEDDDFTKKLNDHLTGSETQKERSHSQREKSHEKNSSSGSKEKEKRKGCSNVFGSEDEVNSSREENVRSRVPSGGGMWIPTGQDSIIDGVKEAINKLGGREKSDKQRSQSGGEKKILSAETKDNYEIKFDKRTGMYIRMPRDGSAAGQNGGSKGSEDITDLESESRGKRAGDNSPTKLPSKRRSKSKSKERTRRPRSRSRSRGRRDRRSRSRRRRSRSRSKRGQRSRSRKRPNRSRSRSRNRRESKGSKRRTKSRSRSSDRSWKERGSYQDAQSSLQQEISGMRQETQRLLSERKEVEREKAKLLTGGGGGGGSRVELKTSDEFSGLDTVMNSVLEVVAPVAPSNIIPGTQTFEDLEAFLKRKKEEKKEVLKKKL